MARYQYKIAAGWNNTAGLTFFEAISVSGGEDLHSIARRIATGTYLLPETFLPYAPNIVITAGGTLTQSGYPKLILNFKVIGTKSYAYLEANYGAGNATHRGKVTIQIPSEDFNTFEQYNAIFKLADAPKATYKNSKYWLENVQATVFIRGLA